MFSVKLLFGLKSWDPLRPTLAVSNSMRTIQMLFFFILRVSSVFLKLVVRLIYKQRKCRLFLTFLVLFYCELWWVMAPMYCENPRRLWPSLSSRKFTSSELQNILRFLQVTWSKDRFGGKNLKSRSSLQRTSRFSIAPPFPPTPQPCPLPFC